MKAIVATQILIAWMIPATMFLIPQSARAQLPAIEDTDEPNPAATSPKAGSDVIASASTLKVTCKDSKTVVQKGERQATMITWTYDGFGKEFNAEKRCEIVSERLQQAANLNGGTFKDLQLASGVVNAKPVICALQSNGKKCSKENILFTLKPENARNPDAVIQKIFGFAQDGTSDLNESASSKPKVDMSLGKWEQNAFPKSGKSNTAVKPSNAKPKTNPNAGGF